LDGPNLIGPEKLLWPDNDQLFEQKLLQDRVTNWTIRDLKKILFNCWKNNVRQEGTFQVETSQPLPGLSQQSFTFNQDVVSIKSKLRWMGPQVQKLERMFTGGAMTTAVPMIIDFSKGKAIFPFASSTIDCKKGSKTRFPSNFRTLRQPVIKNLEAKLVE
jgi:hypothetical protein